MVKISNIEALGTQWWFELFAADPATEAELTNWLTERLTNFDHTYSRFHPDSVIYQLNQTGVIEHPTPECVALLSFGQQLYTDTAGVFNICSAHHQVHNGYGATSSVRNTSTTVVDPTTALTVTSERITLTEGAVDLGGFGKGWLIDELVQALRTMFGLEHFLINGGGDMFATSEPDGSPVEILVEHPTRPGSFVARVPLRNQGFAASSTHKRRWQKNDKEQHHILADHSEDMATHTVAESALVADIYATLACAVAPTSVPALLHEHVHAYLVMQGDTANYSATFEPFLLT